MKGQGEQVGGGPSAERWKYCDGGRGEGFLWHSATIEHLHDDLSRQDLATML